MNKLKTLCIAFVVVAALYMLPVLQGCATTGTISPQLIEQSAAVDTSISRLQTQQATSAEVAAQVSATADALGQTAAEIKNDKISCQITTLKTQVKTLADSLKTEREKTAQIQTDYSTLKISSGTDLVNQSAQINQLSASLRLSHKWNWILVVIIALFVAASVVITLLKFYFHKI
jgi:alanyl-tRNA synthetase